MNTGFELVLTVKNVRNPEWGIPRSPYKSDDLEVMDDDFYGNFDYWSSYFEVRVDDSTSKMV